MRFSRQEYWSGLPFPSSGIFPTQGLNLGLLHYRQILVSQLSVFKFSRGWSSLVLVSALGPITFAPWEGLWLTHLDLNQNFLCNIVNQLNFNLKKIFFKNPEHFLEFPLISLVPLFQSPLLAPSLCQISLVRGPLPLVFGLFFLSICTFLQGFCI